MARKAYILSFDRDDEINYKEFHDKLTQLPGVITWWHYIKSSYIIISNLPNASQLTDLIIPLFPNKKIFFLMELNMKNRNGMLVKEAWEWLKKESAKIT